MTINAYPLHWPAGKPRSNIYCRESSKFKSTFAVARDELLAEIERLRGRWHRNGDAILSTNVELRQDGLPYAGRREPEDSGVAVYFTYKKQQRCFACDKYNKVWENMVAIRKTIEALRGIERWGSSDMMDQAFSGFVALPDNSEKPWWEVLNVFRLAGADDVKKAYRNLRSVHHPDNGGDAAQFDRVQKAYEQWGAQA
jgi:DnaJ domain